MVLSSGSVFVLLQGAHWSTFFFPFSFSPTVSLSSRLWQPWNQSLWSHWNGTNNQESSRNQSTPGDTAYLAVCYRGWKKSDLGQGKWKHSHVLAPTLSSHRHWFWTLIPNKDESNTISFHYSEGLFLKISDKRLAFGVDTWGEQWEWLLLCCVCPEMCPIYRQKVRYFYFYFVCKRVLRRSKLCFLSMHEDTPSPRNAFVFRDLLLRFLTQAQTQLSPHLLHRTSSFKITLIKVIHIGWKCRWEAEKLHFGFCHVLDR